MTTYDLKKPIPVLFIDKEDFNEYGCAQPTSAEIEEVIAQIKDYFINDGTFDQVVADAINHVKSNRDQP